MKQSPSILVGLLIPIGASEVDNYPLMGSLLILLLLLELEWQGQGAGPLHDPPRYLIPSLTLLQSLKRNIHHCHTFAGFGSGPPVHGLP